MKVQTIICVRIYTYIYADTCMCVYIYVCMFIACVGVNDGEEFADRLVLVADILNI